MIFNRHLITPLFFLLFTLSSTSVLSQSCHVSANVNPQTICSGETVNLSASGSCDYIMYETFNDASADVGWDSVSTAMYNNPCGPGPDSLYIWFKDWDRALITEDLDLSSGNCTVKWWMRYGRTSGGGNCNYPNSGSEGVRIEYSTDQGMTWDNFPGPNQQPTGNTNPDPPYTTNIPGSGYYWAPDAQQLSSEIYYWNQYENTFPLVAMTSNTRIRLSQDSHSGPGYDSWGIDNFFVQCSSSGNPNVSWSHGPTSLTPPPITLTNPGNTPLDTCFIVTISDSSDTATDTVCVTVNPSPTSDFSLSDSNLCLNDSLTISYSGNASSQATYHWTFNDTSMSGEGPHSVQTYSTGTKTISLTVTDTLCMSPTTSKTVEVHPFPSVSFIPSTTAGCTQTPISFTNQTQPANSSYLWDFGDGQTSSQINPSHAYDSSGTFMISLTAISPFGCQDSLTHIPIHVNKRPKAMIDTQMISTSEIIYTDISQAGDSSCFLNQRLWNFSSSATPQASQDSIVQVSYPFGGTFKAMLITTNNKGCQDTATMYTVITSIHQHKQNEKIKLYPNPTSGAITVELPDDMDPGSTITLHDNKGRIILTRKTKNKKSLKLNLGTQAKGSYFLTIKYNGSLITKKINLQ